jgi:hypothetical protein
MRGVLGVWGESDVGAVAPFALVEVRQMGKLVQHEKWGRGTIVSENVTVTVRFESGVTMDFPRSESELHRTRWIFALTNRVGNIRAGDCDGCGEPTALVEWRREGARRPVALCTECETASLNADEFKDDIVGGWRVVPGSFGQGKRR